MDRRPIPPLICPDCDTLREFGQPDLTDAPRRHLPPGPGALWVCRGCARVAQLKADWMWELLHPAEPLLRDSEVVAERWKVVEEEGLTVIPEDLAATAATPGAAKVVDIIPEPDPGIEIMMVWPTIAADGTEPPVDFPYAVSVTEQPAHIEWVVTGSHPDGARLIFKVISMVWDDIVEAGASIPGQTFTLTGGDGYEYVLAPVPAHTLDLPDGVSYYQVIWQNEHGHWPWADRGDPVPLFDPTWRPLDRPAITIGYAPPEWAPDPPIDVDEVDWKAIR